MMTEGGLAAGLNHAIKQRTGPRRASIRAHPVPGFPHNDIGPPISMQETMPRSLPRLGLDAVEFGLGDRTGTLADGSRHSIVCKPE